MRELRWVFLLALLGCGAREPHQPPAPATWPFVAWDHAEAFTFNHVDYGPGIPLRVYDPDNGWNPNLVDRKPIDRAQGERAIEWTIATGGEIEVSGCPFPRHAVVFYAGDTPVGSVNVCFTCGDILVWPELEPGPDYDNMTDEDEARWEKRYDEKLAAYEQVYPKWQAFFRDDLGWSVDPWPRPQ